jgi:hypothetical protein
LADIPSTDISPNDTSTTRRWLVSDAVNKMFYMEGGKDGQKNMVVSHEVKGKVVFANLRESREDFDHTLQPVVYKGRNRINQSIFRDNG